MKKLTLSILCIVLLLISAIGLVGCNKEQHTHDFTEQVAENNYLASEATCTEPAKYYYSCACGKKGAETFQIGDALGHSYSIEWSFDETYHWHAATCEHTDEVSDKAKHEFENKACKNCGYVKTKSIGLAFALNDDEKSYSVAGIGTCTDTDIVIPSKYNNLPVTSIAPLAFKECVRMTSVAIPDSVTSIGDFAFSCCNNLTSVTIGNGVTSIGYNVFFNCTGLTSIEIPDSVTSIGSSVFSGCNNLTSVTIGNGVTSIGWWAFEYCSGLTSITIPNSVTSIGSAAFSSCSNLTSVTIGSGVTSIGDYAFV